MPKQLTFEHRLHLVNAERKLVERVISMHNSRPVEEKLGDLQVHYQILSSELIHSKVPLSSFNKFKRNLATMIKQADKFRLSENLTTHAGSVGASEIVVTPCSVHLLSPTGFNDSTHTEHDSVIVFHPNVPESTDANLIAVKGALSKIHHFVTGNLPSEEIMEDSELSAVNLKLAIARNFELKRDKELAYRALTT